MLWAGFSRGRAMPYTVELDTFHGPLDLLLYLVKRNEVDVLDIPIAKLADQFLVYVQAMRELDIIRRKASGAGERLAQQVVGFVQRARALDLFKAPGVAETIDWANALVALDTLSLDPQSVSDTLGVLLKYQDDIARIDAGAGAAILEELRAEGILERHPA